MWLVNTSQRSIRWEFRGNFCWQPCVGGTLYPGRIHCVCVDNVKVRNPLGKEESPPWCFKLSQPSLVGKIVFHTSCLCCWTSYSCDCSLLQIRECIVDMEDEPSGSGLVKLLNKIFPTCTDAVQALRVVYPMLLVWQLDFICHLIFHFK